MPSVITLVIETSTPHGAILLGVGGGILAERKFSSDRSHNADLFGPLNEILEMPAAAGLARVLVGSGPGSYSGTRVGIAAAQGVAIVRKCPAIAVPSVLAVPAAASAAGCLVVGDARRGAYWSVGVRGRKLLEEPVLTDGEGLAAAADAALAEGVALVSFEEIGRFPLGVAAAAAIRQEFPTAAGLFQAWHLADDETRAAWSAAIPQPMYLKPPHITPAKRSWLVR
jgi:tRNA threonylcarbamoyladenosine biosynthesis protein TsaB